MPGLDATRLRALADELEREEAEARREAEDAETRAEREAAEARVAALETKIADLERQLAERGSAPAATDDDDPPAATDDDEPDDESRPKTRKGRKRGQVYQDKPGEPGYVYQGEDEPDIVVIDEDDEAAA